MGTLYQNKNLRKYNTLQTAPLSFQRGGKFEARQAQKLNLINRESKVKIMFKSFVQGPKLSYMSEILTGRKGESHV